MTSLAVAFFVTVVVASFVALVLAAFRRVGRNQRATSECLTDLGIRLVALEAAERARKELTK